MGRTGKRCPDRMVGPLSPFGVGQVQGCCAARLGERDRQALNVRKGARRVSREFPLDHPGGARVHSGRVVVAARTYAQAHASPTRRAGCAPKLFAHSNHQRRPCRAAPPNIPPARAVAHAAWCRARRLRIAHAWNSLERAARVMATTLGWLIRRSTEMAKNSSTSSSLRPSTPTAY